MRRLKKTCLARNFFFVFVFGALSIRRTGQTADDDNDCGDVRCDDCFP